MNSYYDIDTKDIKEKKDKIKDLVKSITGDKLDNIKEVISEINTMIEERKTLSKSLTMSCDKVLSSINGIIGRIPPDALKEEITLHSKIIEIEEIKIKEHLDCWRDVAQLKNELRETLREFRDEENKSNVYSDLLNNE